MNKNTKYVNFISRERSYHGNTVKAIIILSYGSRTTLYDNITTKNVYFVSSCYPYRQMLKNETNEDFVYRKTKELEEKFLEVFFLLV